MKKRKFCSPYGISEHISGNHRQLDSSSMYGSKHLKQKDVLTKVKFVEDHRKAC